MQFKYIIAAQMLHNSYILHILCLTFFRHIDFPYINRPILSYIFTVFIYDRFSRFVIAKQYSITHFIPPYHPFVIAIFKINIFLIYDTTAAIMKLLSSSLGATIHCTITRFKHPFYILATEIRILKQIVWPID